MYNGVNMVVLLSISRPVIWLNKFLTSVGSSVLFMRTSNFFVANEVSIILYASGSFGGIVSPLRNRSKMSTVFISVCIVLVFVRRGVRCRPIIAYNVRALAFVAEFEKHQPTNNAE